MRTRTSSFRTGVLLALCATLAALAPPSRVAAATAPAASATHWVPPALIDFSSRHNVLIRNFDGTYSPMDYPWYQSRMIAPGTWQILTDGDFMYLVEGDDEALMIDSGYGAGNIREYAQALTKKPLRYVANTHSHFDHTANDGYFDRAYMSEETKENLPEPSGSFAGIPFPRNYPIEVIGEGYQFQLGNRELEAIMLGNHAAGGTAYLDRKQRILFSGDEIMGQQGMPLHVSVAQFERMMEKLEAHRSEYDTLCAGWEMLDASWVDKYLAVAKYILAGHEGLPLSQAPPAQPPTNWRAPGDVPADPQGRVIYFRHIPRGTAVLPAGAVAPAGQRHDVPNEYTRRITYDGATLTYDSRNVR